MKWSEYNESLVKRGEILLGFDVLENWDKELDDMNRGKIGEPFHYPDTFVLMLGHAKVYFHLPYRQTEGIVKGYTKEKLPSIPDFSTINRRINRLNVKINDDLNKITKNLKDRYIIIAIDSTGIKVTNRGQWMNKKWNVIRNKKKGYLKIHVAVDIKSKKILSMEVTDEHVHDNKMLPTLVDGVVKSNRFVIDKLFADGAYDSNNTFKCLSEHGITPCIKVRKNSRVRKTGHMLRNLSVIAQRKDIPQWKDSVSYGQRWMVETVFSSIKRMFGEYVYSVKMKNMKQELMLKASLYNKFMSI
ncbi:IS5-like element IS903B family transposase [soil metagenome]